MSEKFKIVITRERVVRKTKPREWHQVATKEDGSAKFDYTPEVETLVTEREDIYEQVVDALCLSDVIRAVNGLS